MRLCTTLAAAAIAVSFLSLPCSRAQTPRTASPVRTPGSVAISPDGQTVAWTIGRGKATELHLTAVADADPGRERIVAPSSATGCGNSAPVWSPDGAWLAYTSTCTTKEDAPGQEQIFLWSKATGESRQLTHVKGLFKQAVWSPDGRTMAFLFVENATRSAGALDAMKPWAGVIGEDNLEIQGVYGVDVATGEGRWIVKPTPAMYVFEFGWAPDSKAVTFTGAAAPGENNWWVAKLYTQDVRGGAARMVLDPGTAAGSLHGLQIAVPRFSPDGKRIAMIGGLMSDFGSTGGDLYVVDAKGGSGSGAAVDVTPGIDGSPVSEEWISDHTLSFVEARRGHTLLSAVNVNDKAIVPGAPVDLGEVSVGGGPVGGSISLSGRMGGGKDRVAAFVMQGVSQAPEVYTEVPGAAPKPLTHLNDGAKAAFRTESVEWENEGFHVQGWLTFPANYDATKRYPLIVMVHGGPSAAVTSRWSESMWPREGYFLFQPNPRGSFGQGEAFVQANRKDFGYGDLRDIEKGMDTLEAKYPIDKRREGLTGWSYGGFMTMFGVTQTHRFRAAVAGAGVSDWLSYYGENSIDQWMVPFFGASVYDDPKVYEKSSAITFIKNVTTPTLVIVGDRDGECPAPQSFEFWHALLAEGVKTQLVIYPNEGHGFRNPEHIADRDQREIRWFAENMPAQ